MTNFKKVKEFMSVFGQAVLKSPELPEEKIILLRLNLIDEENGELKQAILDKNLIEVADALTDLLYVVYGMGHSCGIDLDKCFAEVHRSNMSKLGEDGRPIYRPEDGKVIKGPNYFKPDLSKILLFGRVKRK